MHSKLKSLIAVLTTAAISTIGLSPMAVVSPAAATCTPDGTATIRITNPNIQPGVNAFDASSWNSYSISQGWLPAATKAYIQYLDAGSTFGLTYHVTDSCGSSMANEPVQLRVNANYAGANATFTAYGISIPAGSSGNYGETVLPAINTDQNGLVSFTLTNVDTPVTAESRPANLYDSPPNPPLANELKTAIVPTIANTSTVVDMYWAHFVQPLGNQCTPTGQKQIRIVTPSIVPGTNAYDASSDLGYGVWAPAGSKAYTKYITAGTSFQVGYKVTDSCGTPLSGQSVSLIVNANWSMSTATFTSGATVIPTDDHNGGGQTVLPAQTTGSDGLVTFSLRNTNDPATAEAIPAHPYDRPSGVAEIKTNIVPLMSGNPMAGDYTFDYFWAHFVRDPNAIPAPCIPTATKVIRLMNPLMRPGQNTYDATGWVAPYITAGSKAYLQYMRAGGNLKLTYVVTNNCGTPFADQPVKLKVNANWSCSNATFTADGKAIGPDNCNGGGETVLAARNTNGNGWVTFELTNTNSPATAEPTPGSPSSPPAASVTAAKQEVKTNIQPYIDGTESIDLLFEHFTRDPKMTVSSAATAVKGVFSKVTVNLLGSDALPAGTAKVAITMTGPGALYGNSLIKMSTGETYGLTDSSGNLVVNYRSGANDTGAVGIDFSFVDNAGLTASKHVSLTLSDPVKLVPKVTVTGGTGAITIQATDASGKAIEVSEQGLRKRLIYAVHSNSEHYTLATPAGSQTVKVYLDGKLTVYNVKVN